MLRCLRGGYYMREEVRERILLLAVHDRDAMGYAVRCLASAFQERGGRFSFQLVPTVSKNRVNGRKSVAWVPFSVLFCTHALKTGRRTWRIWMVLQTRGRTGKWVNRRSSTIMQQPPALYESVAV